MSQYPANTVLTRRVPKLDNLDRLRVRGDSPVSSSVRAADWGGAGGQAIVVEPFEGFASPFDIPVDFLVQNYTVESYPENYQPPATTPVSQQPSPEQVFDTLAQAREMAVLPPEEELPPPTVEAEPGVVTAVEQPTPAPAPAKTNPGRKGGRK